MTLDIASLGIHPALLMLTALWLATYGAALAWLISRARTERAAPVCFWLIVIVLVPAGQFVAMLYFFRASRPARAG